MSRDMNRGLPQQSSHYLRLGQPLSGLRPTLHNGPGYRLCLWLQGCSLRCTTVCINPHLLDEKGGDQHTVTQVLTHISECVSRYDQLIEGISVLGGEPLDQATALASLLQGVQALGLNTMVYSGHTLGALRAANDVNIERVLSSTDLLVDGGFEEKQYDAKLAWRGSLNQQLIRLSERYSEQDLQQAMDKQGKAFAIRLAANGEVNLSGLQTRGATLKLSKSLVAKDDLSANPKNTDSTLYSDGPLTKSPILSTPVKSHVE